MPLIWCTPWVGAFVSVPHSHGLKTCPQKSRPVKLSIGTVYTRIHSAMIAIEYTWQQAGQKMIFIYGSKKNQI